jgi:hypothetical protein
LSKNKRAQPEGSLLLWRDLNFSLSTFNFLIDKTRYENRKLIRRRKTLRGGGEPKKAFLLAFPRTGEE